MEVKVLLQVIDMFSEWIKVVPCSLAASGVKPGKVLKGS